MLKYRCFEFVHYQESTEKYIVVLYEISKVEFNLDFLLLQWNVEWGMKWHWVISTGTRHPGMLCNLLRVLPAILMITCFWRLFEHRKVTFKVKATHQYGCAKPLSSWQLCSSTSILHYQIKKKIHVVTKDITLLILPCFLNRRCKDCCSAITM